MQTHQHTTLIYTSILRWTLISEIQNEKKVHLGSEEICTIILGGWRQACTDI